eukprot:9308122-Pyramimonas_sp.AAC.1
MDPTEAKVSVVGAAPSPFLKCTVDRGADLDGADAGAGHLYVGADNAYVTQWRMADGVASAVSVCACVRERVCVCVPVVRRFCVTLACDAHACDAGALLRACLPSLLTLSRLAFAPPLFADEHVHGQPGRFEEVPVLRVAPRRHRGAHSLLSPP